MGTNRIPQRLPRAARRQQDNQGEHVKFGHLELFVVDSQKARDFYEGVLGFELVEVQGECVWLKLGAVEILLRPGTAQPPASDYKHSHAAIVLYTDDLPRTRARLERQGLTFCGSDGTANCPTFTDPDGHWFQLVDPREHA
jgi:catechol 2,3-dioxygenase-like lactoylglutathione lyase family enzyme